MIDSVDSLYQEFELATQQMCRDLAIEYDCIKFSRYETQKTGVDYIAGAPTEQLPRFNFHIRTTTKKADPTSGSMRASLEIVYSESAHPFFVSKNIDHMRGHTNFLQRWVAWGVAQFNMAHRPANLDSLFNGMYIQICGFPRDIQSRTMFELLMSGILNSDVSNVHICIFRHLESSHYRTYSYA